MKKNGIAYLLLIFFGGIGAHEIYLKETKWFLLRLLASCLLALGIFKTTIGNSGQTLTDADFFNNTWILSGFILTTIVTIKTVSDFLLIPLRVKKLNKDQQEKTATN